VAEPHIVTQLLQQQGTYHHHKEQMAHLAAAAYVAGAAWLVTTPPDWGKQRWGLILLSFTALAVFTYVICQLCARKDAARVVDDLVQRLPEHERLPLAERCTGNALVEWVARKAGGVLPLVTLAVMAAWTVVAFYRLTN
jgi:hypothetical protein